MLILLMSNMSPVFAQTQKLCGGTMRIEYLKDPISFNDVLNLRGATAQVNADVYECCGDETSIFWW